MKKPIAYAKFWYSGPDMPRHSSQLFWADARSIEDGKTMFDHYGFDGQSMTFEDYGQWTKVVPLIEFDRVEEE